MVNLSMFTSFKFTNFFYLLLYLITIFGFLQPKIISSNFKLQRYNFILNYPTEFAVLFTDTFWTLHIIPFWGCKDKKIYTKLTMSNHLI